MAMYSNTPIDDDMKIIMRWLGEKEKVMERKGNDLFGQQEFESHQFTTLWVVHIICSLIKSDTIKEWNETSIALFFL